MGPRLSPPRALLLPSCSREDNEIVIDANVYNASLPKALDAIFYPKAAAADEIARATQAHTKVTAFYGLSASALPLLSLDVYAKETPFECVVC